MLWNSTPDVFKSSNTVFTFIKNNKTWSGEVCNCSICIEFRKICSCNIFFVSWYILVLLISINYFSIQLSVNVLLLLLLSLLAVEQWSSDVSVHSSHFIALY